MTHNKYFFSGRLEGVRQTPEGGNLPQDFAPEEVEGGPHEKDVLPLATTSDPFGAASYNINPMLLEAIRMSDLFWNLPQFRTFSEVVDQIYYTVKYATPWVPGTHGKKSTGMQSAVRGVSNAGTPGVAYTMLLKLFVLKLTRDQIKTMLEEVARRTGLASPRGGGQVEERQEHADGQQPDHGPEDDEDQRLEDLGGGRGWAQAVMGGDEGHKKA